MSKNQLKPNYKTVGEASLDLLLQDAPPMDVVELTQMIQKETLKELETIVETHKDYADEYYIQVMPRRERLMKNVIRQQFIVRRSRPIADYDMMLYHVNNKTSEITFCWCVPDPETCHYLLIYEHSLPEEEKELLTFVKKFSKGELV